MNQQRKITHLVGILNDRENKVLTGIGLAVLAGFLFVSSDTVVKLVREDLPVAMVVWGRFVMHLLLMLILFPGKKIIPLFKVNNLKLIIGRGLLLLTCTCLFFTAIGYIGLAEANSIMFVSPFFVVALSIPLLGEKVGIRRWSAVAPAASSRGARSHAAWANPQIFSAPCSPYFLKLTCCFTSC